MQVAYSATIWDDGRSGIGNYISEQLDCLARRQDIEVAILESGGAVLGRDHRPSKTSTGSGIHRMVAPVRDILWHRTGLRKLSRRNQFDLVHIPTIRRLPAKLSCPTVVTVHDLAPMRFRSKYGLLRSFYHRVIIPAWLRRVDAIITPSESTRRDLVDFYGMNPEKITVVPNGIDHFTYHEGSPEESKEILAGRFPVRRPFFVYVSRLEHPAKNHVRLIQAFRRFKESTGLPHQLVLVGGDWHGSEAIHSAAQPLVSSGDILITGYVDKEDLPHFLRACEAMVYPSLFEGFGLPVVEAMACGAPVACSRSSSLTELAEGRGLLFDPENPDEIAASLCRLAASRELRDEIAGKGLAFARDLTWERSIDETIAVWKQCLKR